MSSQIVAMIVGPEYEDLEVWYPKLRLEAAGFTVPLVGIGDHAYSGKHGYPCKVDQNAADIRAADLAGVFIPGGWAPDKIRRNETVLQLVRDVNARSGLVGTVCHGPWVLISAGVVKGRRMTSTIGIRDDVVNAGAIWSDEAVVQDGNIISARTPKDLPALGEALVDWITRRA